jgi:micrococcal nuclease
MKNKILIILLISLVFACRNNKINEKSINEEFINEKKGKVIAVIDGDTFTFLDINYDSTKQRIIRLSNIDAPEKEQEFYQESKRELSNLIFGKNVTVKILSIDINKRWICRVFFDSMDVNKYLVRNGFAWHFGKFSTDSSFEIDQQYAKSLKLNIWSRPNPIPPVVFRHNFNKWKK